MNSYRETWDPRVSLAIRHFWAMLGFVYEWKCTRNSIVPLNLPFLRSLMINRRWLRSSRFFVCFECLFVLQWRRVSSVSTFRDNALKALESNRARQNLNREIFWQLAKCLPIESGNFAHKFYSCRQSLMASNFLMTHFASLNDKLYCHKKLIFVECEAIKVLLENKSTQRF